MVKKAYAGSPPDAMAKAGWSAPQSPAITRINRLKRLCVNPARARKSVQFLGRASGSGMLSGVAAKALTPAGRNGISAAGSGAAWAMAGAATAGDPPPL
jgi:hypothetical protein